MTPSAKSLLQASAIAMVAFFAGQLIPRSTAENDPKNSVHELKMADYNEVKSSIAAQSAQIIDARSATVYSQGHIPNAINLPANSSDAQIQEAITEIGENNPVIVYCADAGCSDSHTLGIKLSQHGHTNIKIYKEGWEEWQILEPTSYR